MARTIIEVFKDEQRAIAAAGELPNTVTFVRVGPTDQVKIIAEGIDPTPLRSGPGQDFFIVISTSDPILGPSKPGDV
jgi:hypothetical protein